MRLLFLLLFLAFTFGSQAQFGKNCELRQLKVNGFSPGVAYEMAAGVNSTLHIEVAYKPSFDPYTAEPIENYVMLPALTVQNRYYYNFFGRDRRGHQIYGNSANYIAPSVSAFGPSFVEDQSTMADGVFATAGLVTGLQRSFNSGFSFSIDAGAAYYLGSFEGGIYPVVNLSLGWIISEKRWCVGK